MSVSSHSGLPLKCRLQMPKTEGDAPSPFGIKWEGPVGQGRMSVEEAFERAKMGRSHELPSPQRMRGPRRR